MLPILRTPRLALRPFPAADASAPIAFTDGTSAARQAAAPSLGFGARLLVATMLMAFLAPLPSRADDIRLASVGLRAGGSGANVLGDVPPEEFEEYAAVANFELPWRRYAESGWGVGTGLMASAGALRGAGETAFVVSLLPVLVLGSRDGRFTLDLGFGGALLSKQRFGVQDFGGAFQFALTLGVSVPVYERLKAGYRFMHYSDAGLHGSNSTGADLHMIEFTYRF